jgi:predicted ATPase
MVLMRKEIERRESLQEFLQSIPVIKEFGRRKMLEFIHRLTFVEYHTLGEVVVKEG